MKERLDEVLDECIIKKYEAGQDVLQISNNSDIIIKRGYNMYRMR